MKKLTQTLLLLCGFCISISLNAQNKDSRYLAGAVPEVNGKVTFTKEFSIPGMQQDEIYDRMQKWMETRLAKNENNSRIVYADAEKGQIVGLGDEWIIFSSTALSLDRTRILYQLTATCKPEKCILEISKIRYIYREGEEKYNAEEWITDKYALNKSKTKLIRGLAKWRRKTVDFIDNLGTEAIKALSAVSSTPLTAEIQPQEDDETILPTTNEPIIVRPQKQVITNNISGQQEENDSSYREIKPDELPADAIQTSAGKLVIVIGAEPFNMTMMTANAGGSIGKMDGKAVIFSILSPEQPHEQIDNAEKYTVRFYPNGQNKPSIILECKKMPSPASVEGMPRTYIGEIVKATIK